MSHHTSYYTINSHNMTLHHQHRLLFVGDEVVKLTPTEHQIMCILLSERIAQDETLAAGALESEGPPTKATRDALEKHVNNIRTKIRPYGLDIHRVHKYGYVLTSEQKKSGKTTIPLKRVLSGF